MPGVGGCGVGVGGCEGGVVAGWGMVAGPVKMITDDPVRLDIFILSDGKIYQTYVPG